MFAFVSCGSDGSSPEADASVGDAGAPDGPWIDAWTADNFVPTPGAGDPCRGTPLPTDQHYVPAGLCARLVATNVLSQRQLTFAPNGDLFAVSRNGTIRLLRDTNGDGTFQPTEVITWATAPGTNGSNCHIDAAGGFLYAGSGDGVVRFPYSPTSMSGGAPQDVVTGQPNGGHTLHTVHVYDGYLYVHSGSAANASNDSNPTTSVYDTQRSLLRRFKLSTFDGTTPLAWLSGEIVNQGLRNMVGFTRNAAGRMYGVVNGLDDVGYQTQDVHNDNPGEQVVQLTMGKNFGYPFCMTAQRIVSGGNLIVPGTQVANENYPSPGVDDAWCAANSTQPATFVQAHSAPLDITFFDSQPSGGLPERWRNGAFIALHGSWDRGPATGSKVVWMPFDAAGNAPMPVSTATTTSFPYETVLGGGNAAGPTDGAWVWSSPAGGEGPRPAGVAISPIDGALYIASDAGGNIYRVGIQK
ncbi:MAG: hypothetical protein ABIP89_23130 [Polyangiaceae bacterium]